MESDVQSVLLQTHLLASCFGKDQVLSKKYGVFFLFYTPNFYLLPPPLKHRNMIFVLLQNIKFQFLYFEKYFLYFPKYFLINKIYGKKRIFDLLFFDPLLHICNFYQSGQFGKGLNISILPPLDPYFVLYYGHPNLVGKVKAALNHTIGNITKIGVKSSQDEKNVFNYKDAYSIRDTAVFS